MGPRLTLRLGWFPFILLGKFSKFSEIRVFNPHALGPPGLRVAAAPGRAGDSRLWAVRVFTALTQKFFESHSNDHWRVHHLLI